MSLIPSLGFGYDPFWDVGGLGGSFGTFGQGFGAGFGRPSRLARTLALPTTTTTALAPFGDDRQLLDFNRLAADPLPVDIEERDKEFLVRVHQREAGMRKRDLRVDIENGMLVIRGEREKEEEKPSIGTYRHSYRSVYRSMALPDIVEQDKIEARYEGNMLTIHLPKAAGTEGTRRSIQIGGQQQGAGTSQSQRQM